MGADNRFKVIICGLFFVNFLGEEIAYIYPDLKTAVVGKFKNGLLVISSNLIVFTGVAWRDGHKSNKKMRNRKRNNNREEIKYE